jgi:hypothetical protein
MKCSLSNIEGLSAQIENLGNLGPDQLDQAWRDVFESDRPAELNAETLLNRIDLPLEWQAQRDELDIQ